MAKQVDASTTSAGALFSDNRFFVPEFQRRYKWRSDTEVDEFWTDLASALGTEEYFLGLVILTEGRERREVVDGQQRFVTLSILANILRLKAAELGRSLVADGLRSDFLEAVDYETEARTPRLALSDPDDGSNLRTLLSAASLADLESMGDSAIFRAHDRLRHQLELDLDSHERPAVRVGQWSEFITKRITFAVFTHPGYGEAYRVFEVINTRGRALAPAELIKAYLIGSTSSDEQSATYDRWYQIESQITEASRPEEITTFVRHVVTLERGYITPKDLYHVVSTTYVGSEGVERLLDALERNLPPYLQLLDPSVDFDAPDARTRAFAIVSHLSLARFRPIMLAACHVDDEPAAYEQILHLILPGALVGSFSTGSIEAQFARAAKRMMDTRDWSAEVDRLKAVRPTREEFEARFNRGLSREAAHVMIATAAQQTTIPSLDGYAHQVRPRNGINWPDFSSEDFKTVGTLLGNWTVLDVERRPHGTREPDQVVAKLVPHQTQNLTVSEGDLDSWSVERVKDRTADLVGRAAEVWYGTE